MVSKIIIGVKYDYLNLRLFQFYPQSVCLLLPSNGPFGFAVKLSWFPFDTSKTHNTDSPGNQVDKTSSLSCVIFGRELNFDYRTKRWKFSEKFLDYCLEQ